MKRVKCKYKISLGLVTTIISLTKLEKGEVWSILADASQVCFDRINNNQNMKKSWRWWTFPNTPLRLKIIVNSYSSSIDCSIKLDSNIVETFTSEQVDEFLIEKILLAD